jgi:capsular exopolysaccharide synthesis family protein
MLGLNRSQVEEQESEFDIRGLAGIARRRAWIVVLCVVVLAAGAYVYSSSQPDQYAATSEVHITDPNADAVFSGVQVHNDPKREVDTQTLIAKSTQVRACANKTLGASASQVDRITVSGTGDTDILLIRAESHSPEVAQKASIAVTDCYVASRHTSLVKDFQQRIAALQKQSAALAKKIAALNANPGAKGPATPIGVQLVDLQNQKDEIDQSANEAVVDSAVSSGNVELISHATLPTKPFAPKPAQDAILAAGLGLLVGVLIVFLLERVDETVGLDDLERVSGGAPVLGNIPLQASSSLKHHHLPERPRTLVGARSVDAEAYRTVTTSLRFSDLGRKKRIIAVTSASMSEGKSTVTANLAVAMAQGGRRVVAISGDLRRPSLAQYFGVDEQGVGLTSVLVGDVPVSGAVVKVVDPDASGLLILPVGPLPHNPAEMLGSAAMQQLLQGLVSAGADYVLIDCPPVLAVSDTLSVAEYVDGVIVVCVPGQTKTEDLSDACGRLRQVGVEIIGVVANGVSEKRAKYAPYYAEEPTATAEGARPAAPLTSATATRTAPVTATNGASHGPATDVTHEVEVPVTGDEDVSRN